MHNLISQDITNQEEQLARFKEEVGSSDIEKVTGTYQQRIMDFLEFLNVMRGRYEHATFQEKRNASKSWVYGWWRMSRHKPMAYLQTLLPEEWNYHTIQSGTFSVGSPR